jgi:hypothetical protein
LIADQADLAQLPGPLCHKGKPVIIFFEKAIGRKIYISPAAVKEAERLGFHIVVCDHLYNRELPRLSWTESTAYRLDHKNVRCLTVDSIHQILMSKKHDSPLSNNWSYVSVDDGSNSDDAAEEELASNGEDNQDPSHPHDQERQAMHSLAAEIFLFDHQDPAKGILGMLFGK